MNPYYLIGFSYISIAAILYAFWKGYKYGFKLAREMNK